MQFESSGDVLNIRQTFTGQDAQGHMRITTFLDGRIPDISQDAQVEIDDYYEEYRRASPGRWQHVDIVPGNEKCLLSTFERDTKFVICYALSNSVHSAY